METYQYAAWLHDLRPKVSVGHPWMCNREDRSMVHIGSISLAVHVLSSTYDWWGSWMLCERSELIEKIHNKFFSWMTIDESDDNGKPTLKMDLNDSTT